MYTRISSRFCMFKGGFNNVSCNPLLFSTPSHSLYKRVIRSFMTSADVIERFENIAKSVTYEPADYISESMTFVDPTAETRNDKNNFSERSVLDEYSLENVENALTHFVPEYILSQDKGNDADDYMTPGLAFFMENKEQLIENVRNIYNKKKGSLDEMPSDILSEDINEESFGSYDLDTVIHQKKHHLWDYNTTGISKPRKIIELTKGKMPSIQQIIDILEQERITDILTLDLDKYKKRDKGLYVIVATGTTGAHCRRVGRMLYRIVVDLHVPFVSKISYCCHSRSEDWIIVHLGPLSVHLMVKKVREEYGLDEIWSETEAITNNISHEYINE